MSLPQEARVVIIGGGILGCSIAYHLGKLGWGKETVLLERKKLTSGTTWHAAGLVRASLYSESLTKLAKYTTELYQTLEQETEQATGFVQPGSLSVATSDARWEEFRRGADMLQSFEVECIELDRAGVQEKWPLLNTDDVIGGIFYPKDGKCNPADTTMALAKGARMKGVKIFEDTKVEDVLVENGRVTGVRTPEGIIKAEYVVCAAGMWSREIGQKLGVNIPLHACEHFYIVTEPMEGMTPDLPVMRDMDQCAYYKEDAGKLLLGAFEPKAKPWGMDGIREDFCFDELPEDFDHFAPILEGAMHRVPSLQKVGIRKFFNGPESFTADQRYILGPAPELKNFFVAAGFNSIGIQSGGGAGMALAHWIVDGEPPLDLWDVDIRRLQPHMSRKSFLVPRVSEALGLLYAMHWPYRQFESSRNVRQTAFYEDWKSLGACFGEVAGWERPNWYAPKGVKPEYEYAYGRQNWFPYAAEDVKATREGVALYDLSTFAKFLVVGKGAEELLQRVSSADISQTGKATYTQWLNEKGGIEADLTVFRISETKFMVVTAAATSIRDWYYLKDRIVPGSDVELVDMTTSYATLGVMGPKSRELLKRLTDADLSNAGFPFGATKHIELRNAKVRATRISYVGELGWELYIPAEFARGVLRDVLEAGADLGVRPAGMHAMDACRIEKAYRHWGHDIGPKDTVLEAGLGFTCAFDKKVPFIGRDAVLRQKEEGKLGRRMVQFRLTDPAPLLYHNEPIYRNGTLVGLVTSANYGHHLGGAIGMGYVHHKDGVDAAFIAEGKFEISVALKRFAAEASLAPMYDPKSARMRV
ncbi:MAG: FAD-dependent oxidoreductase [Rhodospirillaceae bacterium]|nr:FAD-dependent oxidoreductase [Rhodospirillaceae bacterium]